MTAPASALPAFTELVDLAGRRLGARTLACSDDFFAEAENLLNPEPAVFIPGKFTDRGKWMDGWESRRKRTPGHDWCIIRLGVPGIVRGFTIDTAHFNGNQPEHCTIEAAEAPADPPGGGADWFPILDRTPLGPAQAHHVAADAGAARRVTHLRLNIFPDGGVARLRAYGEVLPEWPAIRSGGAAVDLACAALGGVVVDANNMHFGSRHNLIMPDRAANMGDGWETRRKRGLTWDGARPRESDWCIVRLGHRAHIQHVEIDTSHFKGNFPESAEIEACDAPPAPAIPAAGVPWHTILPRTPLRADHQHRYQRELSLHGPATHVRLRIFPDGGVSRLRIHGLPV